MEGRWVPGAYVHFTLSERGKTRPIDAPRIQDRQVHKVFTKKVLLPLYTPSMIYNNGASLPGKGFEFSKRELREDLRWHFRRYGREGYIILIDFKQFFPSVSHEELFKRHEQLLLHPDIRKIGDDVINTVPGEKGLPLGVEPSQAEMIAFPSALDNYIKCQLGMKCAGHYMDDYYIILPDVEQLKNVVREMVRRFEAMGIRVNKRKCQIIPLTKPFRFCKARFTLGPTGKVTVNGSRDGIKRARRKLKLFHREFVEGKRPFFDIEQFMECQSSYYRNFDDHGRLLRLQRLYHAIFFGGKDKCSELQKAGPSLA